MKYFFNGLHSRQYRGREYNSRPRVVVPLLIKYKVLINERFIDFSLPLVTKLGFKLAIYINRVLEVHAKEGIKSVLVFINKV